MKNRDVTIYKAIENYGATASLSALYNLDTKEYYGIHISFEDHPIFIGVWDNGEYIFNYCYPFLLRWKSRQLTEKDLSSDLYNDDKAWEWDENDINELIDIIETAIDLGWDKL